MRYKELSRRYRCGNVADQLDRLAAIEIGRIGQAIVVRLPGVADDRVMVKVVGDKRDLVGQRCKILFIQRRTIADHETALTFMTVAKLLVSLQQRSVLSQYRLFSQSMVQRLRHRTGTPPHPTQKVERAALQHARQTIAPQ